jgi:hypothetical protein
VKYTIRNSILALLIGASTTALTASLQRMFKPDSGPYILCDLFLLPGKILAVFLPNRGTASPEFIAYTYGTSCLLFGGVAFLALLRARQAVPRYPKRDP